MSIVDTFRALDAEICGGDLERAAAYLADDFMFVGATPQPLDKQAAIGLWRTMRQAFPDFNHNTTDVVARNGKLYAAVAVSGTHRGELRVPGLPPIPASGKPVQLPREPIQLSYRGNQFTEWVVEQVPDGGLRGVLNQIGASVPAL